jgi:hypothetical protein
MIKTTLTLLAGFAITCGATAQVKIGDNPTVINESALLELESAGKALILPRVANTQAIATPANGMVVYDISEGCVKAYANGAWSGCMNGAAPGGGSSSNGTAEVLSYNCSGSAAGTLTAGEPVLNATQSVSVTVASPGTYSVSATANGVTFSGAGTWASAGTYTLLLSAWGTPVSAGVSTFTLNTVPSCSFTRVVGAAFSNAVCATSYGQFPATATVSGQSITITKPGTNTQVNSDSDCGITTSSNKAVRIYYGQSASFTFSQPLSNVQCYLSGVNGYQDNEGITASAYLNGVPVAVQLVSFAGCTEEFDTSLQGNSGVIKCNTDSTSDTAVIFNVSSAGPYNQLVIARNSTETSGSVYLELMLCNAVLP